MFKRLIFHMLLGVVFFLLIIWINLIIWGGSYFDKHCVRGRLKKEHIQAIISVGWNKEPIKEKDRIISYECSEFLRAAHFRDIDWWVPYRDWIQSKIFGEAM